MIRLYYRDKKSYHEWADGYIYASREDKGWILKERSYVRANSKCPNGIEFEIQHIKYKPMIAPIYVRNGKGEDERIW